MVSRTQRRPLIGLPCHQAVISLLRPLVSCQQKGGDKLGYEAEAFAIYDTMRYIKPPIGTVCVGNAYGEAGMLLAAGEPVRKPDFGLEADTADTYCLDWRFKAWSPSVRCRGCISNIGYISRLHRRNIALSPPQMPSLLNFARVVLEGVAQCSQCKCKQSLGPQVRADVGVRSCSVLTAAGLNAPSHARTAGQAGVAAISDHHAAPANPAVPADAGVRHRHLPERTPEDQRRDRARPFGLGFCAREPRTSYAPSPRSACPTSTNFAPDAVAAHPADTGLSPLRQDIRDTL